MRVLKIYVFALGIKERSKFEEFFTFSSLGDFAESCVYSKRLHAYVLGFRSHSDFSESTGILCLNGWNYCCDIH